VLLLHSTDEKFLLKILQDGYLKSGSQTKNNQMFGQKQGSKYIYLSLGKSNDLYANIYLDPKLLLNCIFYLNIGWNGDPKYEHINGNQLNEIELNSILKKFNNKIKNNMKKNEESFILMSNEIFH
jgi:hypothetical protein